MRATSREIESWLQPGDVVVSAAVFAGLAARAPLWAGAHPAAGGLELLPLGLVASLAWPVAFRFLHLHSRGRQETLGELGRHAVLAGAIAMLAQGTAAFATQAPVGKLLPLACAALQSGLLFLVRAAAHTFTRWERRAGRDARNVLIAGSGPRAAYVEDVIARHAEWGLRIVGFVDRGTPPGGASVDSHRIYPMDHIRDLLTDQVIDEVIVACPRSKLEDVASVVDAAADAGVPITVLSDIFGDFLPTPRVKRFGTLPALNFAPVHHSNLGLAVKRGTDVAVAGLLLLLTAPLLGAAALAIKLDSPGPVLFRQVRCSLNGRHFVMPKLRTMYVDAESRREKLAHRNEMDGPVFKVQDDPRVTSVGRWLRRYSIDELPQLWSVLRGHMSLVGPRPPIPTEVASYRTFERRRLSMRPGLTCIWQVSGRNEVGFDDWVRMDLEYIDTWSLTSDLRILLRTVPAVLSGQGAS